MEGKFELQFEDNEYYLVDGNTNDTVATTDKVLLKEYDGYMKKLSLKNCQAIENGYDLDELAEKHYDVHIKQGHTKEDSLQRKIDFILGFQKALEILGDKNFSDEDIKNCWNKAFDVGYNFGHEQGDSTIANEDIDNYIQSLQQTEWDVTFNPDEKDSDGCLILKRK